jgi:hypothetical protein
LAQVPEELHVSGVSPLHEVVPGTQLPWHVPLTHALVCAVQLVVSLHWPVAPHDSTKLSPPSQPTDPETQTPSHVPFTHVWLLHAVPATH